MRLLGESDGAKVDIHRFERAMWGFRELRKASPDLGAGPMTLVDPLELDRLCQYAFPQMFVSRHRASIGPVNKPDMVESRPCRVTNEGSSGNEKDLRDGQKHTISASESRDSSLSQGCTASGDDASHTEGSEEEVYTLRAADISAAFDEAVQALQAKGQEQSWSLDRPLVPQSSVRVRDAPVRNSFMTKYRRIGPLFDSVSARGLRCLLLCYT